MSLKGKGSPDISPHPPLTPTWPKQGLGSGRRGNPFDAAPGRADQEAPFPSPGSHEDLKAFMLVLLPRSSERSSNLARGAQLVRTGTQLELSLLLTPKLESLSLNPEGLGGEALCPRKPVREPKETRPWPWAACPPLSYSGFGVVTLSRRQLMPGVPMRKEGPCQRTVHSPGGLGPGGSPGTRILVY